MLTNINKLNGGKAIGSGGFGCVFKPALKCVNKEREKTKISKLMKTKYAEQEYNDIKKIHEKLNSINNYRDYFLIDDFNICTPDKLTKDDLHNLKICNVLKKSDITSKNINNQLNGLKIINMPYGGIQVDDFVYQHNNFILIIGLINSLIKLLKEGIIPMNQKGIYHSDIKDSNILVYLTDQNKITTRLIDWNLSVEYNKNTSQSFPKNWHNRPLQFNVPFSIILFTDLFKERYNKFISENKMNNEYKNKPKLTKFIVKYLEKWREKRGEGHFKYINKIFGMIFKTDFLIGGRKHSSRSRSSSSSSSSSRRSRRQRKMIEEEYTKPYICNYLVEILIHFTVLDKDGKIDLSVYLNDVFIKIIDIWGFIITYLPLFELLYNNYNDLNNEQIEIFIKFRQLFLKYLYNPRISPININDLVNDLESINNYIRDEYKRDKYKRDKITRSISKYNQTNKLKKSSKNTTLKKIKEI